MIQLIAVWFVVIVCIIVVVRFFVRGMKQGSCDCASCAACDCDGRIDKSYIPEEKHEQKECYSGDRGKP